MTSPEVRLDQVSKRYTTAADLVVAAHDVSLTFGGGDIVCLYGASGSGKSTLVRLIAGIERPDAGVIEVLGMPVHTLTGAQSTRMRLDHVGVVFQRDNLLEPFTALENVYIPLSVRGLSRAEATEAAMAALESVGIADLRDRLPERMSGGQRQRVGIARAIAGNRSVLLADEPTGALDSHTSASLYELLQSIAAQGTAVLVVSHDPECASYATRTMRMTDGRLDEGKVPTA